MRYKRAHVLLREGLVREIDALAGRRGRSAFLVKNRRRRSSSDPPPAQKMRILLDTRSSPTPFAPAKIAASCWLSWSAKKVMSSRPRHSRSRSSMPECALGKSEERLRSSQTFYASSSTRLSRAQVVISKRNGHERVERWQSWTVPSPQWPFTINACSPLTIAKTFRCPRCNCILYHRDWGEPHD